MAGFRTTNPDGGGGLFAKAHHLVFNGSSMIGTQQVYIKDDRSEDGEYITVHYDVRHL